MTEKRTALLDRYNKDAEEYGVPVYPGVSLIPAALTPNEVVALAWLARIEAKLDALLGPEAEVEEAPKPHRRARFGRKPADH